MVTYMKNKKMESGSHDLSYFTRYRCRSGYVSVDFGRILTTFEWKMATISISRMRLMAGRGV